MTRETPINISGIVALERLPAFKNLAASFDQQAKEWKAWFRADDPPPEKVSVEPLLRFLLKTPDSI